jgi:hypothetical protein
MKVRRLGKSEEGGEEEYEKKVRRRRDEGEKVRKK